VYTGTEGTGSKSEEIKQCEILIFLGNRVRAEEVPMLAIDVTQLVFSPGLFGVVHRQGRTMLEDIGGCDND